MRFISHDELHGLGRVQAVDIEFDVRSLVEDLDAEL
jgi:hypothetical protein